MLVPVTISHKSPCIHVEMSEINFIVNHRVYRPLYSPLILVFMDMSSAEARDDLRCAVEDEMKALEEHTCASKRRRNAPVPISQLPPETLFMIFSFLSASLCVGKARYSPLLRVTISAINDMKPHSATPTPGVVSIPLCCRRLSSPRYWLGLRRRLYIRRQDYLSERRKAGRLRE